MHSEKSLTILSHRQLHLSSNYPFQGHADVIDIDTRIDHCHEHAIDNVKIFIGIL